MFVAKVGDHFIICFTLSWAALYTITIWLWTYSNCLRASFFTATQSILPLDRKYFMNEPLKNTPNLLDNIQSCFSSLRQQHLCSVHSYPCVLDNILSKVVDLLLSSWQQGWSRWVQTCLIHTHSGPSLAPSEGWDSTLDTQGDSARRIAMTMWFANRPREILQIYSWVSGWSSSCSMFSQFCHWVAELIIFAQ